MAYVFRLPDIGEGLTEAEVVEWLIGLGEPVDLDAPLVQVETDKAVSEIPSPAGGVLLHQGGPAGSTVAVGDILAVIGQPGETWTPAPEPSPEPASGEALPIVGTLVEAEPAGIGQALPLVRKLAAEMGVDLSAVRGTGPGGRVTREDVEAAARGGDSGGDERIRLTGMRRTIAERMARSWREIPHVTTFGQADGTALLALRRDLSDAWDGPVPFEALFIDAVIPALRRHPEFNASVTGEEVILRRRYDIGVAVNTPDGLVVAVIKGADRMPPRDLAGEVARLGAAARSRTATPAELSGATFTISNIGAVGGGHGTPIIPYGTTAILSFGRIEERPVVRDGQVRVAPMLPLSLSYDHRLIDGALGRTFLGMVIEALERPPAAGPDRIS